VYQQQVSPFAHKEWKISPFFLLFLDALTQLIKLNPADFEYNVQYVTYIASQIYTNQYYEFVQGDDPLSTSIAHYKLRSIFTSITNLGPYTNPVYCMSSNSNLLYRF
jgi:hypothetical protein